MGHPTARRLSLLLITLALGLCAPEGDATQVLAPPRLVDADDARLTPACDAASGDEIGPPGSKTTHAIVAAGAAEGARLDPTPVATVLPLAPTVHGWVAGDVPCSRAPPLG